MKRSVKVKVLLKGRSAVWLDQSGLRMQYKRLKKETRWTESMLEHKILLAFFLENIVMIQREIQAVTRTALNCIGCTYVFKTVAALKVDIPGS